MTTDALAPFTLPLRREGDAAIVDATGETVLVIDPDRHLENDEDAARLADRVFAMLTAAPVREEGGAVDDAVKIATDLHHAYEQLIYGLPKYLEAENLTDEENMIREAWITLDVTAHRIAALATREEAPTCKKCGDKGYTEYEGGEGEGYPSRPEIGACSCRQEAPAEAGEVRRAIKCLTFELDRVHPNHKTMFVHVADLRVALSALRAKPQAREEAQPVAKVVRQGFATGSLFYTEHGQRADLPDGTTLYTTPPAPETEKLREAVEALERIATVDMGGGFLGAQACRQVATKALSNMKANQKGGE